MCVVMSCCLMKFFQSHMRFVLQGSCCIFSFLEFSWPKLANSHSMIHPFCYWESKLKYSPGSLMIRENHQRCAKLFLHAWWTWIFFKGQGSKLRVLLIQITWSLGYTYQIEKLHDSELETSDPCCYLLELFWHWLTGHCRGQQPFKNCSSCRDFAQCCPEGEEVCT